MGKTNREEEEAKLGGEEDTFEFDATAAVEELMLKLAGKYTIVIVTHNMAQARRVSDECIFMLLGKIIEHDRTQQIFLSPKEKKTSDYIEGRYG